MNKKIQTLMNTAKLWAKESYCKRKQVGAVLAKDDRILATGYNGTISGLENKCENEAIIYDNKHYNSIWDFVKNYKIKLFNTKKVDIDFYYELKISLYTENEKMKIYFIIDEEEYKKLKPELYEKAQKEKLEILRNFFNDFENKLLKELKRLNYIEIGKVTSDFV